jgi:hypothetical protein
MDDSEARAQADGSRCHGPVTAKLHVTVETKAIGLDRSKDGASA